MRASGVLALSQVSAAIVAGELAGLRGNLLIGGAGIAIGQRAEWSRGRTAAGGMRMAMAEYRAGTNRLAIPRPHPQAGTRRRAAVRRGWQPPAADLPGGTVTGDRTCRSRGAGSAGRGPDAGDTPARRCGSSRWRCRVWNWRDSS